MSSAIIWDVYESPIGPLTLIAGEAGLRGLWFPGKTPAPAEAARGPLPAVTEQLEAYFQGELTAFDLKLDMRGTLEREVWRRLLDIPYGKTESYASSPSASTPTSSAPPASRGSGPARSAPPTAATRCRSSFPVTG
jgi:methylated-DNA-[protein]-cysteine S-methyltransferase